MIMDVQWQELIRRWTQDYSLTGSNRVRTFLEPRGSMIIGQKLQATDWRYAATGSLAAVHKISVAPVRLFALYVDRIDEAAERLEVRPAESGANVFLLEPFDSVVFERTWKKFNATFAALSQVAADLLTSPGRGPAEGEELLRWMKQNEDEWRR